MSIFDFMHFMARQGFHTSITEVVAELVFSKFSLRRADEQLLGSKLNVYDWYLQAIADALQDRVSNLKVVSTLMQKVIRLQPSVSNVTSERTASVLDCDCAP